MITSPIGSFSINRSARPDITGTSTYQITAINTAPRRPAPYPSKVTPPLTPLGTTLRVFNEIGGFFDNLPISPAQVSLVASATDAPNITIAANMIFAFEYESETAKTTAARADISPFASTCIRSLLPLFFSMNFPSSF